MYAWATYLVALCATRRKKTLDTWSKYNVLSVYNQIYLSISNLRKSSRARREGEKKTTALEDNNIVSSMLSRVEVASTPLKALLLHFIP